MPANGFTPPPAGLSKGFEWSPAYDMLIDQISTTNMVDADWPVLRDILKYKLSETIADFLSKGPPWQIAPEEAYRMRGEAYEALDNFTGPPFTIQRMCELLLEPRKNYASLPKFLRALLRTINVTSERSAFTEAQEDANDFSFASTSATTLDLPASMPAVTRRPSIDRTPTPLSNPRASPSSIPLLSPIPWLTRDKELETMSDVSLGDGIGSPTPIVPVSEPFNPVTSAVPDTATPTGGLVDEVDPGSGGQETAEPVALTSSASTTSTSPPGKKSPPKSTTLQERFERASSPKVEMPLDPEEAEEGKALDPDSKMKEA